MVNSIVTRCDDKELDRESPEVLERDAWLQAQIGPQLLEISKWAGGRMSEGDAVSIRLLREYVSIILGAVEPAKVAVLLEGEAVGG